MLAGDFKAIETVFLIIHFASIIIVHMFTIVMFQFILNMTEKVAGDKNLFCYTVYNKILNNLSKPCFYV